MSMKYIIIITIGLGLFGCGDYKRFISKITGEAQEFCHKGVSYLQFPSGASVQYNKDGKIATCE